MDEAPGLSRHKSLLSHAWVWLACLLLVAQGAVSAPAAPVEIRHAESGVSAIRFVREHRAILQARFAAAAHVTQDRTSIADKRAGDGGHAPSLPPHAISVPPPLGLCNSWRTALVTDWISGQGPCVYQARAPPRSA